jgi:hypothetical protein
VGPARKAVTGRCERRPDTACPQPSLRRLSEPDLPGQVARRRFGAERPRENSNGFRPTQLTTVTLTDGRTIQDAGVSDTPIYIAQTVAFRADHERLRNLVLTASGGFETVAYCGANRQDQQTNIHVGGRYTMNCLVVLEISYTYLKQTTSQPQLGVNYDNNMMIGTVRFRL